MNLFLAFVIFLAAFVCICLGGIWVLQRAIQARIEAQFRAAEAIVNNHCIPDAWLKQLRTQSKAGLEADARAKAHFFKKMDALISYFRSCSFVDSEESREVLLEELGQIRKSWEDCTWSELLALAPIGQYRGAGKYQ